MPDDADDIIAAILSLNGTMGPQPIPLDAETLVDRFFQVRKALWERRQVEPEDRITRVPDEL